MKYGDVAWTEPEPAGRDPAAPVDPRLLDKAYVAPPAGGFLTVGGTDDEVALNAGRLPPGHAPVVPVPPTAVITVPGGAVDVAAVITLTGTYGAGSYIDVTRTASGDPDTPVGAPYPIDRNMDASAVAAGWGSYLAIGIGYTVMVEGGVITLTPDPGETILLEGLFVVGPVPLVITIDTAAGDTEIPAVLSVAGAAQPGDMVTIVVTTDVEANTRDWIAPAVQSALTVAKSLAGVLRTVPGADAMNKNLLVNVLANSGNTTVNLDSVLTTLASVGGAGGDGGPVDPPVEPPGTDSAPETLGIDVDGDGVVDHTYTLDETP
jgi:hypothetical protein